VYKKCGIRVHLPEESEISGSYSSEYEDDSLMASTTRYHITDKCHLHAKEKSLIQVRKMRTAEMNDMFDVPCNSC
jgi:hypothetical protein